MSTKNIECQLAQGQIGRYLNGERFSPDAIHQLEAHVADCDECSELVTRRRQALLTMLGERNGNLAVVRTDKSASRPESSALNESTSQSQSVPNTNEQTVEQKAPASSPVKILAQLMSSKPLLYCTGLAIILLAMSYFSKGALKTFGPMADQSSPIETAPVHPIVKVATVKSPIADKPAKTVTAKAPESAKTPAAAAATSNTPAKAPGAKPAATSTTNEAPKPTPANTSSAAKPAQTIKASTGTPQLLTIRAKRITSRRVHRTIRHHVRLQTPTAPIQEGIRLYDANGKLIK